MGNLVIVAIPEQDDPVWAYSSDKVPHLTLCFLGDTDSVSIQDQNQITQFLEHAANVSLGKFWLDVDHRGTLGPDDADVLFFTKDGWDDGNKITRFRDYLLRNDNIHKAYLAAQQYPVWQPHLTMGYPTAPAKPLKDPFRKIYTVSFDKIALWTGNFEGTEFELKRPTFDPGVAMSSVEDILAHHGIKGMKWGVRRTDTTPTGVAVTTRLRGSKHRVKTSGGERHPLHPDAAEAKVAAQKAKKSGLHALSNEELRVLSRRLDLEKKVADLAKDQLASKGEKVVSALIEANKQLA